MVDERDRACECTSSAGLFSGDPINLVAAWSLPVSKTGLEALGHVRRHGCSCGGGQFTRMCPAHTLWRQRAALRAWFPDRHTPDGTPHPDLPLFPDAHGNACTKQGMVDTVRAAAHYLGLPPCAPDGLPCWSGHSLRVGGAQGLSIAGLDTWAIQLLGRWGSQAVLGYIREAPLASAHRWALEASTSASVAGTLPSIMLEDLLSRLMGTAIASTRRLTDS